MADHLFGFFNGVQGWAVVGHLPGLLGLGALLDLVIHHHATDVVHALGLVDHLSAEYRNPARAHASIKGELKVCGIAVAGGAGAYVFSRFTLGFSGVDITLMFNSEMILVGVKEVIHQPSEGGTAMPDECGVTCSGRSELGDQRYGEYLCRRPTQRAIRSVQAEPEQNP
ncbi:hypothetical protein [Pseudomonas sp. 210_17 TE3656]